MENYLKLRLYLFGKFTMRFSELKKKRETN